MQIDFPVQTTDSYFLVTGEKKEDVKYNYCSTARNYHHMCGDYAKHYFTKDTDHIEYIRGNGGGDSDDDFSGLIQSLFSSKQMAS